MGISYLLAEESLFPQLRAVCPNVHVVPFDVVY